MLDGRAREVSVENGHGWFFSVLLRKGKREEKGCLGGEQEGGQVQRIG